MIDAIVLGPGDELSLGTSFFDVFFEIELEELDLGPQSLVNGAPVTILNSSLTGPLPLAMIGNEWLFTGDNLITEPGMAWLEITGRLSRFLLTAEGTAVPAPALPLLGSLGLLLAVAGR
jgi:hypothetical protein